MASKVDVMDVLGRASWFADSSALHDELIEVRRAVAELIDAVKEQTDAEDRKAHAYIILKANVRVRAALAGVGA